MRQEATLNEWKKLYETATRIEQIEPWKYFWDTDLIAITKENEPDDITIYSVMGAADVSYGLVVYEGYEAYNSLMMLLMADQLNLTTEYAMFNQKNITCYWGEEDELSERQLEIINELGYDNKGEHGWLFFMSYEPKYFPFDLNQEEVVRMTTHLENLEIALAKYKELESPIEFDGTNMFLVELSDDNSIVYAGEEPYPHMSYQYSTPKLGDQELLKELKESKQGPGILEVDIRPLVIQVGEGIDERPMNPFVSIVIDTFKERIHTFLLNKPEDDERLNLLEAIIDFILIEGKPQEIKVSNDLIESLVYQLCEDCNIKLTQVEYLDEIEFFWGTIKETL